VPPLLIPWQDFVVSALAFSAISAVLLAIAFREWRTHRRTLSAALICFAILLAILATNSGIAAQRQFVAANTYRFHYVLEINQTTPQTESLVVPAPESTFLLDNLRVVSGVANWGLAETAYGRGLFVQFSGDAVIESTWSGYAPGGPSWIITPTLRDSNASDGAPRVWIRYEGFAGVTIRLDIQFWRLGTALEPGWSTYFIDNTPPP